MNLKLQFMSQLSISILENYFKKKIKKKILMIFYKPLVRFCFQ